MMPAEIATRGTPVLQHPDTLSRRRRFFWRLLRSGVAACLLFAAGPAAAADHVLLLIAEAPGSPGGLIIRSQFESALAPAPIASDVSSETLDITRPFDERQDQTLADLIATKYESQPPALVIPIGASALDFAVRHRDDLFPGAAILFGSVDERIVAGRSLGANVSGVYMRVEASRTLRTLASIMPALRKVVVVAGAAQMDRQWLDVVREDLRELDLPLEITYLEGLPLREVLNELSGLGPDSAVYYVSMAMDGDGIGMVPSDLVRTFRRATDAPIVGLSASYLGNGILGGTLLDVARHAQDLAGQAKTLLGSGTLAALPSMTTPSLTAFDWRELQRFGVGETALPRGVTVAYRPPSPWIAHRSTLLAAGGSAVAMLLLGAALFERRRHLRNEAMLIDMHRIAALVEDLLVGLTMVPLAHLDDAMKAALDRTAEATGGDAVWVWDADLDGGDRGWMPVTLQSGESVVLTRNAALATGFDLPKASLAPEIDAERQPSVVVATPLAASDNVLLGVLFWASARPSVPQQVVRNLRVVAKTLAQALQRKRIEGAVENSERLKEAVLSSMVSPIAILDADGVVLEVNEAWRRLAHSEDAHVLATPLPGVGFKSVCERAARDGVYCAAEALTAITRACAGEPAATEIEYATGSGDRERWVSMRVTPLARDEHGAVVIQRDVTADKRDERLRHIVSGRLLTAQEDERRRIAHQLHDDLGQRVALLAIEIDQASTRSREGGSDRFRALSERTAEIATEIHRLSHRLHSARLDALGVAAALRGECRDMQSAGLAVSFIDDGIPTDLPRPIGLCIFRVVQEALNNVLQHSGVQSAEVELNCNGEYIEARIADAGKGFDPHGVDRGGLGLIGMRERVAQHGGTLQVESQPGSGTTIVARVPLDAMPGPLAVDQYDLTA